MPAAQFPLEGQEGAKAEFILVYDHACGVVESERARIALLQQQGLALPPDAAEWVPYTTSVIDKFHFGNHTGALCKRLCNPYKCAITAKINMEVQEQCFR